MMTKHIDDDDRILSKLWLPLQTWWLHWIGFFVTIPTFLGDSNRQNDYGVCHDERHCWRFFWFRQQGFLKEKRWMCEPSSEGSEMDNRSWARGSTDNHHHHHRICHMWYIRSGEPIYLYCHGLDYDYPFRRPPKRVGTGRVRGTSTLNSNHSRGFLSSPRSVPKTAICRHCWIMLYYHCSYHFPVITFQAENLRTLGDFLPHFWQVCWLVANVLTFWWLRRL